MRGRTELVQYNLLQYARSEARPFLKIQTSIVVVMGDMILSFVAHIIEKTKLLLNFLLGFGSGGVHHLFISPPHA